MLVLHGNMGSDCSRAMRHLSGSDAEQIGRVLLAPFAPCGLLCRQESIISAQNFPSPLDMCCCLSHCSSKGLAHKDSLLTLGFRDHYLLSNHCPETILAIMQRCYKGLAATTVLAKLSQRSPEQCVGGRSGEASFHIPKLYTYPGCIQNARVSQ